MYSIVFVKTTEFNVRISPTLCEQYICILVETQGFGFKIEICLLIAPVPVHCFSIIFFYIFHNM